MNPSASTGIAQSKRGQEPFLFAALSRCRGWLVSKKVPDPFSSAKTGDRKDGVALWIVLAVWAGLMAPLLWWGLPSRADDELLFGGEPAWSAARYDASGALRAREQREAGADTDLNPLTARDQIACLTANEAARAEILRRYRLYSRQPDEMITFMALQRMRPAEWDFDPKLYQYGGGYVYLIGAALATSAALGITHLTRDLGTYLEQPELFARFYIVARVVTLVFGALLLAAVWKLVRRTAGNTAAWLALLFTACTPVFITGVLEAKPHLPSACLILWAIRSGLDYAARGRRWDAFRMGLQGGYALGLVLTGIVAAALWPAVLIARWRSATASRGSRRRLLLDLSGAALLAGAVFLATNPYIPYNCLRGRASLASNIANSTAMYVGQMQKAGASALRVGGLLYESCGPGCLIVGLLGLVLLLRARRCETLLAASPGLVMLVIAVLLGAGKPAEYARFLILPVSLLCAAAGFIAGQLVRRRRGWGVLAATIVLLPMGTPAYLVSFATDARGRNEPRHLAGWYLKGHLGAEDAIGVLQEPAPYAVPPLEFARRSVYWMPASKPVAVREHELPTWLVFTADDENAHRTTWWAAYYRLVKRVPPRGTDLSPIAWASKPTFLCRRGQPQEPAGSVSEPQEP